MKSMRPAVVVAAVAVAAVIAWLLFVGLPRWYRPQSSDVATEVAVEGSDTPNPKIKARLFFVTADGGSLTAVEQDVSFADDPVDQAREIVRAQLASPEPPLVSAVPEGTTLRALFLTPRGEAYVDLSRELRTAHRGGSVFELLTIYTIVHALTANLPAVTSVQLLVDGKEIETLAGHVNLQRPLTQNLDWVQ